MGLVKIRRLDTGLAFAAPPLRRSGPLESTTVAQLVKGLGISAQDVIAHSWCDNGPLHTLSWEPHMSIIMCLF